MKNTLTILFLMTGLSLSTQALSQISFELEDVCNSDVELIDSLVQIVETGTTDIVYLNENEREQVTIVLAEDENQIETISDKIRLVLLACSEGRIFQERHSKIINAIQN